MHPHGRDDPRVGDATTDDQLDGDEVYCPRCNGSFLPLVDHCPDDGTRLIRWRAPRDPLLGSVVDNRFAIVRTLGEGGMGLVYEAVQLAVDRPVALKVIRAPLARDRSAAKRFLREARLLTSFNHPNIVNVFDYGQSADGAVFLVMELLRGDTLADVLETAGRFGPRRACDVAVQLCDALACAHALGVVHRDLKPGNIVILDAPVPDMVKVLDFGLAKSLAGDDASAMTLTQAGAILGTPLYMAPEAIAGFATPQTDLYAVGSILYEMLAGAAPFANPSVHVVIARQLAEPPPPLPASVPPTLAALVRALLAKAPEDRPASAEAVRTMLAGLIAGGELDVDHGAVASEDVPTMLHKRLAPPRDPRPALEPAAARSTIKGVPPAAMSPLAAPPVAPLAATPPRRPAEQPTTLTSPPWSRVELAALMIGTTLLVALITALVYLVRS